MIRPFYSTRTMRVAAVSAVLATLAACGGGSDEAPAQGTPTPPPPTQTNPDPVVGVQTPDSVSVVTATNAG